MSMFCPICGKRLGSGDRIRLSWLPDSDRWFVEHLLPTDEARCFSADYEHEVTVDGTSIANQVVDILAGIKGPCP